MPSEISYGVPQLRVLRGLSRCLGRAAFQGLMHSYGANQDWVTVYFITVPTNAWISEGSWVSDKPLCLDIIPQKSAKHLFLCSFVC